MSIMTMYTVPGVVRCRTKSAWENYAVRLAARQNVKGQRILGQRVGKSDARCGKSCVTLSFVQRDKAEYTM